MSVNKYFLGETISSRSNVFLIVYRVCLRFFLATCESSASQSRFAACSREIVFLIAKQ